jgi:hypothetical protein
MPTMKLTPFLVAFLFFFVMFMATIARGQSDREEGGGDVAAPLEPAPPDLDETRLFIELLAHNEMRNVALAGYTEQRIYAVTDMTGKVRAEETGRMEYRAPDKKNFATTSESGSALVRRLALNPLIASEIDAASAKQHHDSAITPANYSLELIGVQQVGPYRCIVARAVPKRPDKYLFEGKVWIDTQDYAVVRIAGHPAKKLSFWIEQADFIREYQKVDGFWVSKKDQTFVRVRMYGEKILTIDHQNYSIDGAGSADESVQNSGN